MILIVRGLKSVNNQKLNLRLLAVDHVINDPLILFGRRVRKLRKNLGLTQEAFALKCGLDRSYMGAVERGERNIALLNICKIADTLDVTPSELVNFSEIGL